MQAVTNKVSPQWHGHSHTDHTMTLLVFIQDNW